MRRAHALRGVLRAVVAHLLGERRRTRRRLHPVARARGEIHPATSDRAVLAKALPGHRRLSTDLDRGGDTDAAAGVLAVTLLLTGEVEGTDAPSRGQRVIVEQVLRYDPGNFELEA